MSGVTERRVTEISAADAYDLRRRVLREGRAAADVAFPEDDAPGAVHLGVAGADGVMVAVVSLSPQPAPHRPGARAARLRGLAVEPEHQGEGLGRLLVEAAL
jgi:GNAT superfamily N-acetyltransferase